MTRGWSEERTHLGRGFSLATVECMYPSGACMEASMRIIIHSAWELRRVRSELLVHGYGAGNFGNVLWKTVIRDGDLLW